MNSAIVFAVVCTGHEKRVAIWTRVNGSLGGDIATGAGTIFDEERPAKPLGQPLIEDACEDIGSTAGRESDNDAHRSRRVGLRLRDPRQDRQRGSGRGQTQKLPARKFHGCLPI
jgi:hypothetical protein